MSHSPKAASADHNDAASSASNRSNGHFKHHPNLSNIDPAVMTRRILRKLDLWVIPPLAMMFLAAFIDRSNIGNARIAGLQTDTHLKGNQFNIALAVFYIPYVLVELPSNWVLKKIRPNIWLPVLVMAWGIVTTLSGLVHNFGGLLAVRMILGLCEGGLLPGIILYLSTIYQRHDLQLRVSLFYASASLSGAFGGLLASAILKLNGLGNLAGWRWIFILEGIVSILVAIGCLLILPESLAKARFLTKEERAFAQNRFREINLVADLAPQSASRKPLDAEFGEKEDITRSDELTAAHVVHQEEEQFEWREVIRGIFEIQVWVTGIAYFGLLVSLYSFSLFLPTIVAGLGFSGERAQLHTVPPYVPATVLTILVAVYADRLHWRGPFILICMPITIAGYILILVAKTNSARYAATFLIGAGVYPSAPCILSILPNNSAGHYKKATTTALQLAIANCGAFVATFAYTSDQAKTFYHKGHKIALGCVCVTWVLTAVNVIYCMRENKARREGRRESNVDKYRELWNSNRTRAPIGDRSPAFLFTL